MKDSMQPLFRPSGGHPPYAVANVIGDKQCAYSVDRHANRTAQRITLRTDKAGEVSTLNSMENQHQVGMVCAF